MKRKQREAQRLVCDFQDESITFDNRSAKMLPWFSVLTCLSFEGLGLIGPNATTADHKPSHVCLDLLLCHNVSQLNPNSENHFY